jgi:cell division protein FtsN
MEKKLQRGGFFFGMLAGLVIGLVGSLIIAVMVTKAPLPFINKVPQRTPEQDAAELDKNRNWDPNAPLSGRTTPRSTTPSSVSTGAPTGTVAAMTPPPVPSVASSPRATASVLPADPSAILSGKTPESSSVGQGGSSAAGGYTYFVQAGAFNDPDEAEQQRARLAMMGMEPRVTQRDQSGRSVFRVRVGPFDERADADATKERLAGAGIEGALVRVQR